MDTGSNKSLFTMIAVVIFGIFLSLSYWMFQDEMKNVLASVMDGVSEVTGVKIDNSLVGNLGGIEVPNIPEEVLVPNEASDFTIHVTTGSITGYKGTRKDVVIPSEINGIIVKGISNYTFEGKGLTSVVLPESIINIGYKAFYNNKLTTITLGSNITTISDYAFSVNSLTSVKLPESLTSISNYAFQYNKLTSVYIPKNVKGIGAKAFHSNPITNAEVPEATSIGWLAFPVEYTRY